MTEHNWKPGDVAMVRCSDGNERRAISGKALLDDSPVWVFRDGTRRDADRSIARPLVVIDPEDREQVDNLCKALVEAMYRAGDERSAANGVYPATLAAALREFAAPTPPRPDEPRGLGAVVEDADDIAWVQFYSKTGHWWRNGQGVTQRWANIDVARVLSEGVVA